MAGTSILATICAERLTKFLTRYSKVQTGNLRCNIPTESIRPNIASPTVQVAPVERKYSLWQSAEYQIQMPHLEKPKSLENIYGFTVGRSHPQQRLVTTEPRPKVGALQRSKLISVSRMCLIDSNEPQTPEYPTTSQSELTSSQVLAQTRARAHALGKYASTLIQKREHSQTSPYLSAFPLCQKYC